MELKKVFIFLLFLCSELLSVALCWHSFGNTPYHCWPITASAGNPTPVSCSGVILRWIVKPPSEIKAAVEFNVTYELVLESAFYTWAINNGYFDTAGPSGFTNAAAAKNWCESTICPDYTSATEDNCCVHHVNVHSCPLVQTTNSLCGPWIPDDGQVFTHSKVMVGPVQTGNWTSYIPGLIQEGLTSIIAHFKVVDLHLALEAKVTVLPKSDCGNGICESEDNEDCSTCPKDCGTCPLRAWQIGLIGTFSVLIAVGIAAVLGYLRYQKRKLLWDESWIIPYEKIKEDDGLRGAFGSMMSVNVSCGSELNGKSSQMAMSAVRKQVFAKTAIYDGKTVAVRKIPKKEFAVTEKIRWEVKSIRELDHPNLCKFVGASVVVPNVCIISEYCPKGSLSDVLLNDEIPLNWAFRFSFAADIARGMEYLHSKKMYHGRLKSNNCVVDDRWTVKISGVMFAIIRTDYGLKEFRKKVTNNFDKNDDYSDDDYDDNNVYKEQQERVYIATELKGLEFWEPTPYGDVYAFAVILAEIGTRNDPFGEEDPYFLPATWKPPLPDLTTEDKENACPCPSKFLQLIDECWDCNPSKRPTMDQAKKSIHKMNPHKMSPVDLMMSMMEKYSKHLESIVAERTQDLTQEKLKTDRLLYSMLPKSVADDLKYGRPIDAEQFDSCTIYFSDIVGFTSLSGGSTPIQVVALLNKLYTTFDSIIDKYDVYKVETIGDAYMVVSGIPVRTYLHSREVADMALDLVAACKVFVIPHKPGEALRIRVGLHSGPACAGVVGLKMPRYCLFGDTVNTASRMESNGEAYKIHISNYTYVELKNLGGFNYESRGTIPVKGKGDMQTWWLLGRSDDYEAIHRRLSSIKTKDVKDSPSRKGSTKDNCDDSSKLTPSNSINVIYAQMNAENNDKNADDLTPVELPDDSTKTRKISNISASNDSGYNEKAEDESTQMRAVVVQSSLSFEDIQDTQEEE